MEHLYTVFSKHPNSYKHVMIWVACYLAYFGLLKVSEFTKASADFFNQSTDMLLSDIALDSRTSPTLVRITLKQCKNDQLRKGNNICLGKTSHEICPVKALVRYLAIWGDTPGLLFLLPSKKSLTRAYFSRALDKAFEELNMNPHHFNTHSYQIGATTSAKQAGVSDSVLKALGRWKSDTYLKYVRLSPLDLAHL